MTTDIVNYTEENRAYLAELIALYCGDRGLTLNRFAEAHQLDHHPVYAASNKSPITQENLKAILDVVLVQSPRCRKKYPMPLERRRAGGYK